MELRTLAGSTRSPTPTDTRSRPPGSRGVRMYTHRILTSSVIAVAMLAAAADASAQVSARVPDRGTTEQLQKLSAKPTPKLADGRTDFNGTWDHLGGIEFVRPQTKADGSICLIGCGGPPGDPFPPVQTEFHKTKPRTPAMQMERR